MRFQKQTGVEEIFKKDKSTNSIPTRFQNKRHRPDVCSIMYKLKRGFTKRNLANLSFYTNLTK